MARRKRSRKTSSPIEDDDTTANESGAVSYGGLTNDTDAPWKPVYSEDRAVKYGLVSVYGRTTSDENWETTHVLQNLVQPLRITTPSMPIHVGSVWNGDQEIAVDTIMEALPRIVTTPGDLTDTEIRADVLVYFEGIIDLAAMYFPAAAMKGYGNSNPSLTGYIDNYLANTGCKPWQMRQMQTTWRSLPIPPKLIKYLMDFYAVKAHPRIANLHHFIPPIGTSIGEVNGVLQVNTNSEFQSRFLTMRAAMTNYNETLVYLKTGGYPLMEFPTELAPVMDAKAWELQVDNSPMAFPSYINDGNKMIALPTSGFKDRLIAGTRYTGDLGPSMARTLCPTYMGKETLGWNAEAKVFQTQNTAAHRAIVVSMGNFPLYGESNDWEGTGTTDSPTIYGSFLNWQDSTYPYPVMGPTNGRVSSVAAARLGLLKSFCANVRITSAGTNPSDVNNLYWKNAIVGDSTLAGAGQLIFGTTNDPNSFDAKELAPNVANLRQIYDAFLTP